MIWKYIENNRLLWWFAAEDPYLLSFCSRRTKRRLAFNGLIVIIVMIATGISISFGVYEILESYYTGLILGIYFAILVMFLYMFILYTLTKDVLPPKVKSLYGRYSSRTIRIAFLVFLGILVSQPIEYKLFSGLVNDQLNESIHKEILNRNTKLNKEYVLRLREYKEQNYNEKALTNEIARFSEEKAEKLKNFTDNQYNKNFFIRKLMLMDTQPETRFIWVFSLGFVILFLTPVYLKIYIDKKTNYYIIKEKIQRKLILSHYSSYKRSISNNLFKNFKEFDLSFKTKYSDPPFNSKLIDKEKIRDEIEFEKWFLSEGN